MGKYSGKISSKVEVLRQDRSLQPVDPPAPNYGCEDLRLAIWRPTPAPSTQGTAPRAKPRDKGAIVVHYTSGCDATVSFAGRQVAIPQRHMVAYWGGVYAHATVSADGVGQFISLQVPLPSVLRWNLPQRFTRALIGGDIIVNQRIEPIDALAFTRWAEEQTSTNPVIPALLLGELETRFRRLAATGWTTLDGQEQTGERGKVGSTMRHIERILRFIANNYASPITVQDVAEQVRISPSYAMTLFRRVVGIPIKEHIRQVRLSHAKMLLASSDAKIINIAMDSGFGSLSSFYEAFQADLAQTPAAYRRTVRLPST